MDVFFLPNSRARYCRRNSPFDDFFRSQWGYPYSFYDEDFPVADYPFPLTRRNVSFIVPTGRYFQRRAEDKSDKSESKEDDKTKTEEKPKDAPPADENKCLQRRPDDFVRNLINLEEVFPSFDQFSSLLKTSDKGPFEVNVNLHGCDPDKIKVEIKDGVLKVEGRRETSDGSYTFVKHEQTIPGNIDPSKLKASLLPEGILKLRQDEETHIIPISMEGANQCDESKKTQS